MIDDSLNFLDQWCLGGNFSVGAIHPETEAVAWLTCEDLEQVREFLELHALGYMDTYFQPNTIRGDASGSRARREHVAVAECVHAEVDPPNTITTPDELGRWQDARRDEYLSAQHWTDLGLPRPTCVIFSGTGYALLWRLVEALPLWSQGEDGAWRQDASRVSEIERRNRWLVRALGADPAATDVSRLLRLPGSINHLKPSKAAHGRVGPTVARVLDFDPDRVADLSQIPAIEPQVAGPQRDRPDFAGRPSDENWERAVALLVEAWPPRGTRHHAFMHLTGALAHAGWPVDAMTDLTTEVAERMDGSDEKAIRDRPIMAQQTWDKMQAGGLVTGWPRLEEMLTGDGPATVRAVCQALGIGGQSLIGDLAPMDAVLARLSAVARPRRAPEADAVPAVALTSVQVTVAIGAFARKGTQSRDAQVRADAEYIRRARKGDALTVGDEDLATALCLAARAFARAIPAGTDPIPYIRSELGASARDLHTDLPEIAQMAAEAVATERASVGASSFVLYTTGPSTGSPIPNNQRNFDIAVARLGVSLRYDRFADKKLIRMGPDEPEEVLQDHHVNRLRQKIDEEFAFKPSKDELYDLVDDRARLASFHPVIDYLYGLPEHDGAPRVGTGETPGWLTTYLGAPDTDYVRAVSRLMLVAAVRRVRHPGCKFDEMVILEGEQGSGKSTALAVLCPRPEWFTDDISLNVDTKKLIEDTDGKWICEAGELKGKRQEDLTRLKSMLSRAVDSSRMSYGRETRVRPRHFILIGTTNEAQYLRDLTGDRRYWPIATGVIDLPGLIRDRDQLWAEALMLDQLHPEASYIRLDPSLYDDARAEQELRKVDDPHVEILDRYVGGLTGTIRVTDLWKLLGHHEERLPSKGDQGHIADALRTLGWSRCKSRVAGGERGTWYEKGTVEERRVILQVTGSMMQSYKVVPAAAVPARGVSTTPRSVGPEKPSDN